MQLRAHKDDGDRIDVACTEDGYLNIEVGQTDDSALAAASTLGLACGENGELRVAA